MVGILFWNLHRSQTACELLAQATSEHSADVVITAECPLTRLALAGILEERTGSHFHSYTGKDGDRIFVFTKAPITCGGPVSDMPHLYISDLHIPDHPSLLLGGFHNISVLEYDLEDVQEQASIAAEYVRFAERTARHSRTVVIGDFNLPPFDRAMVKAGGFYAIMDRKLVASATQRRVLFNDYPLFYNPMWSMLGDIAHKPPGSYHYYKAKHLNYYWYMYDQVLLRPELLPMFHEKDIAIVTRIGGANLLNADGTPDAEVASDHLPIFLKLSDS